MILQQQIGTSPKKLNWYFNRLRCMGSLEIGYRFLDTLRTQAQCYGFFTAPEIPDPDFSRTSKSINIDISEINKTKYLQAAQQVLEGRFRIFALKDVGIGPIPDWNRDPLTGKHAPHIFGKTLNYRDIKQVGDIKYLWELNRHLQLVTIAQAYYLSGDPSYLKGLKVQLTSWLTQCPYPIGPNWISALELAIRLINWSFAWHLVGGIDSPLFEGREGKAFRERWLTAIYRHTHFIRNNFSRFSSANNHLIGECTGLYVAAITWPFWPDLRSWGQIAQRRLVQETLLQNSSDGVNREQAIWYQQFVLDFLLLAGLLGRANNQKFPDSYWERIEAMLTFLASLMDSSGNMPMIGDADDGLVVCLSQEPDFCPFRSLLATGAVLYRRADFKAKAGRLDDKTRWLLGNRSEEFHSIQSDTIKLPVKQNFPEGGYYVLGSDFETPKEVRIIVDAGSLGYLSIAAHAHADALAFILSVRGREFLTDPGTYAYHTNHKWRNYFRSTAAHNTVRVDRMDQSVMGGNFMWTHHANAKCENFLSSDKLDYFCGFHDGYTRLPDPVTHLREISLNKQTRKILVTDTLACKQSHTIERFWHFSDQCRIFREKNFVIADNHGIRIRMLPLEEEIEIVDIRGDAVEPLGWFSRRFDEKVPATTLIWRSKIVGTTILKTEIDCSAA